MSSQAPRQLYVIVTDDWMPGPCHKVYTSLEGLRRAAAGRRDVIWEKGVEVWSVSLEGSGSCEQTSLVALGVKLGEEPEGRRRVRERMAHRAD